MKMGVIATWKDTVKFLPIAAVFTFTVAAIYLTAGTTTKVVTPQNLVLLKEHVTKNGTKPSSAPNRENGTGCNLFSGKWVYDDVSYPLYREKNCALMEEGFACEKYGRKNLTYQNWRWQPHHCHLPKFDGKALLEKLRNKKLVFVGDSLNRNQWRSLLCLIEPHLPPSTNFSTQLEGRFLNFPVKDYNATISFYWSPFLVESDQDDTLKHRAADKRTVRLNSIEKHGSSWIHADYLIFDTFAWWIIPKLTLLWGPFDRGDAVYKQVNTSGREYEVALSTWSDWLEFQVDRNRTRIFFMSASPFQLGFTLWGTSTKCYNTTQPIFEESFWPNAVKRSLMEAVESTIEKLGKRGVKVEYLNITQLSGYREDAHPSIYKQFWRSAMKDFNPNKYSDCIHWCIPGVPDVWNEILYAYIMKP